MIYELRIYTCVPGKAPLVLKRFEQVVMGFWKRHGRRPVGFWTVVVGDSSSKIYYLLGWETMAEREQKWPSFINDKEWHKARDVTEQQGPLVADIVSMMLQPTSFSPMQ